MGVVCAIQNCNHAYPRSPCRFFYARSEWKNILQFTERKLKAPRVCSCHFPKHFSEKRLKSSTPAIKREKQRLNMLICGVSSCRADSKRDKRKFYQIPMIDQRDDFKELSQKRQSAWISALGGSNRDPSLYKNILVCDSHFISGSSAKILDTTNPDWVPTQNMGGIEFISVDGDDEDFYAETVDDTSETTLSCSSYVLETTDAGNNTSNQATSTNEDVKPFKAGEILRDENGQFTFVCIHCASVNENCLEMTKHIDSHFDTNGLLIHLDTELSAAPEFISCAVPVDIDMINESETDILNGSFYETTVEPCKRKTVIETALEPGPSSVSSDFKMKSELLESPTKWRFGEKYKLLYSKNQSPALNVTPAILGTKSDDPHRQKLRLVQPFKLLYSTDGIKNPTNNLSVVGKMKSETARPPESMKMKTDISRLQKLPFAKPIQIPHANHASTTSVVTLSRTLSVDEKKNTETQRTRGWRFGERYQIIYDNPPKSKLTASKDLVKRETPSYYGMLKMECYQCNSEPPAASESDPKPHKCLHCSVRFSNHIEYKAHFIKIHDNKLSKCYQCESEPPIRNTSDSRRHKCRICKEWSFNHMEFETHLKDVHELDFNMFSAMQSNSYEFSCYVCEKDFPVRSYLKEHMKVHHDKYLEHQCPTCGLRYRTYGTLTQHLKTHEGQTFKCDECDKEFPYYAKLRRHLWCHKTELDYICDLCSKGFKMRKYLKRHMAVHNDVKLICRYCDATFNFSSCRRVHEKSQHNVV